MSVDQMKVKEYTCNIKNDKFQFMNSKSIIILIDLKNDAKAYFMNTSINLSNFQFLTSRTKSFKTSWYQWYKWLTYLNMINVKRLVNMSIDIDVNSTDSLENEEFSESICEICVINCYEHVWINQNSDNVMLSLNLAHLYWILQVILSTSSHCSALSSFISFIIFLNKHIWYITSHLYQV